MTRRARRRSAGRWWPVSVVVGIASGLALSPYVSAPAARSSERSTPPTVTDVLSTTVLSGGSSPSPSGPPASPIASGGAPGPAAGAVTAAYVPVARARLADTRTGTGVEPLDDGALRIVVAGRSGVPDAASAVVIALDVSGGEATVWPSGSPRPGSPVVPVGRATRAATVTTTVALGAGGAIDLATPSGAAVSVDVVGAFVPADSARAGRFVAVAPARLTDTRGWRSPLAVGERIVVPLGPRVPAGASSAVVHVTVDQSTRAGTVAAYAVGATPSGGVVSTDGAGQTRTGLGLVPLGASAALELRAQTGGHLIVDLVGWFTGDEAPEATDGLFVPIAARRIVDTRAAGRTIGVGGTVRIEAPVGAAAIVGNVVGEAAAAQSGYVTASGGTTSTLSFSPGEPSTNMLVAQDRLEVGGGAAHLTFDLTGYFVGSVAAPADDVAAATVGASDARWLAAVSATSVPADLIVATSETSLEPRTNPINGRRGGTRPPAAGFGCTIDRAAPRTCLVATLDALGLDVASGTAADRERRLRQAIAVLQLDAGLPVTGVPDRVLYAHLGIWPGGTPFGADEVRVVGRSQQGRPIAAYRFGSGAKVTLVVGVTHGDEEAGLRVLLRAMRSARPADVTLWVVPVANPDGLALDTRFLADGADPNRNALAGPEHQAVAALARTVRPALAVYYHQNYGWIGGSGASMDPAAAYFEVTQLGALKRSGDCALGFLWCPIDDELGISSILVELPDVVTPAVVHDHSRALLTVASR